MKAAVLESTRTLVVKDVPDPEPAGAMAVVRVKACGICLTDYKAFTGERTNVTFPSINGHEFSGVVESVGPAVRFIKPGDEVIASPVASCGTCTQCRRGKMHYCTRGASIGGDGMGVLLGGALAEKVLVPELALYPNRSISFEAAAHRSRSKPPRSPSRWATRGRDSSSNPSSNSARTSSSSVPAAWAC